MKNLPICLLGLIFLVVGLTFIAEVDGEEPTITITIVSRGLRWIGEPSQLSVKTVLGELVNTTSISPAPGGIIEWSITAPRITTPALFRVEIYQDSENVFLLEAEVLRSMIKVTRIMYNEKRVAPHGDFLMEVSFIGWFFTVELFLPVFAESVVAEAIIDDLPVQAIVSHGQGGITISVQDVVFIGERSLFEVFVRTREQELAVIRGLVTQSGLREITIVRGVLESIVARAYVTSGTRKAYVPNSILQLKYVAEEAVQVIKVTEVNVTSMEVIKGNVPVRLLAYSSGSFFEPPWLISNAMFEITLKGLNVTRVYSNNSTAYLPAGEKVFVRVHAPGFKPQEHVITVENETRVLEFYLEAEQPSPLQTFIELIYNVVTNRLFVPVMLGLIAGLLIILLFKR